MNETKVLDELKMWSDVNAEEFTAVNLSALARGCDMRRVDAVEVCRTFSLRETWSRCELSPLDRTRMCSD